MMTITMKAMMMQEVKRMKGERKEGTKCEVS